MKSNPTLIALIVVSLIAVFAISKCSNNKNDYQRIERSISSLKDSIRIIIKKDGTKEFQDNVPQMTAKEILESEEFKNLSKTQQEYYQELKKQKNLIAALRQEIIVRDSAINKLSYQIASLKPTFTDTSVCFNYKTKLDLSDSSKKNLKYNLFLTFEKDSIKKEFNYQYSLVTKSAWKMDKKKNILVTTNFDDPNASLQKNDGLLIPYDEMGRNKFEKWNNKNRYWLKWVERSIIFFAGTQIK